MDSPPLSTQEEAQLLVLIREKKALGEPLFRRFLGLLYQETLLASRRLVPEEERGELCSWFVQQIADQAQKGSLGVSFTPGSGLSFARYVARLLPLRYKSYRDAEKREVLPCSEKTESLSQDADQRRGDMPVEEGASAVRERPRLLFCLCHPEKPSQVQRVLALQLWALIDWSAPGHPAARAGIEDWLGGAQGLARLEALRQQRRQELQLPIQDCQKRLRRLREQQNELQARRGARSEEQRARAFQRCREQLWRNQAKLHRLSLTATCWPLKAADLVKLLAILEDNAYQLLSRGRREIEKHLVLPDQPARGSLSLRDLFKTKPAPRRPFKETPHEP